jgi:hypothetical protein
MGLEARLMQTLGTGQGFAKIGILGFAGSGKTRTAIECAIGIRAYFGLTGPIALMDTEGGSEYVAQMVRDHTGRDLVGVRARSFDQMMTLAHEIDGSDVSVFIVDSLSHPWTELCRTRLVEVNRALEKKGRPPRTRLEFQDWAALKEKWAAWPEWFLNSRRHVIVCGRAGYIWDFEETDEGRKELIKSGIKMKVEGDFGFEPSLLIEMQMAQEETRDGFVLKRRARCIKDRFGIMDGATAENPTFDFIEPHIKLLKPGAHAPVDTTTASDLGVDESGDDRWQRDRKTRTILAEEVQAELVAAWPGQDAASKKKKVDAIKAAFGTGSWTAVESMSEEKLRAGLAAIRTLIVGHPPEGT